jgi:hypothetical protein
LPHPFIPWSSSKGLAFDATDLAESFGGQLLYALVPPRADGSTHLVLDPLELIEKLAAYSGDRGAS